MIRILMNFITPCLVTNSLLYRELKAEKEEILKHKWLESEKVGYDIGYHKALVDWVINHRSGWRAYRKQNQFLP